MKCYVCSKPTAFMIKCDNCGDTRCTSAGCVGTICTKPGKYHGALAPCNCCSGKNGRYQKV
jgi:hypothetical protein